MGLIEQADETDQDQTTCSVQSDLRSMLTARVFSPMAPKGLLNTPAFQSLYKKYTICHELTVEIKLY